MNFFAEYLILFFENQKEIFSIVLKLVKTLTFLVVIFHILACLWISVGEFPDGWVTRLDEDEKKSYWYIYVTSIYFIVTTSTTDGYGDYYAFNVQEKSYTVIQALTAIIIFSVINANILSLKLPQSMKEFTKQREQHIIKILYQMDQLKDVYFDNIIYDSSVKYIIDASTYGVFT